jgi:hypothetical protein
MNKVAIMAVEESLEGVGTRPRSLHGIDAGSLKIR